MCAKVNKPSEGGIRQGFRWGWCHVVGCDTCTSCQNREEHVGLMTRQRWSGKHDPLPQGGPVYCGFLFRGAQSHGVPRDAVSPRPSHVKPHHLPLYPMHPHLHLCFDSRPRQTPNLLAAEAPRSHGDSAQGHSVGLDDLDLQGQTKRPIQSRGARSGGRQSVLLDTGPEYTRKKRKKIGSVQRLIASNQPSDINTSCHLEATRRTKRELVRVG